jgi:hypothetical protein
MVFRESFTNRVFLRFLRRLLRHARRPVFLILARHPAQLAAEVARWVAQRADRLRLCFLTGYSPNLNPDEFLNHAVKSNALGRRRPRDAAELLGSVRSSGAPSGSRRLSSATFTLPACSTQLCESVTYKVLLVIS